MSTVAHVKTVAVGDGAVGKTSMFIRFTTGKFPEEWVPTVFENHLYEEKLGEVLCQLSLWDTAGSEDYDRLRPLSYPQTDVFILCFDIVRKGSYENITSSWIPELGYHCPGVPIILVGTKIDLRGGEKETTSTETGMSLGQQIGAAKYCEISSLDGTGIKELFQDVLEIGYEHHLMQQKKKRKGCSLL